MRVLLRRAVQVAVAHGVPTRSSRGRPRVPLLPTQSAARGDGQMLGESQPAQAAAVADTTDLSRLYQDQRQE